MFPLLLNLPLPPVFVSPLPLLLLLFYLPLIYIRPTSTQSSLSKTTNFQSIKMSANKSSAVADEPIDVLVALQDKFDLLDMAGPVEAFTNALHDFKDPGKS